MSGIGKRLPCLDQLIRDERGTMTIEFVLWVPLIVALLITAVDATTLYVMHTEMSNVARDTARRMVSGVIRSEQEAEDYAVRAMRMRTAPYAVEASYDKNNAAMLRIAIAFSDISIVGYASPLTIFASTVSARAIMRPDPRLPFKQSGNGGGKNA